MSEARLYLVCGLPGAGKTTRARRIAGAVGAVHLCADDWVTGLGIGLLDYTFRVKLQDCLLVEAEKILRAGASVIVEFGSWHRSERDGIRRAAERAGARTELHFLHGPIEELARRVRARGGPDAEALARDVLIGSHERFEVPAEDETAAYDRYVGPTDPWEPG